LSAQNKSNLKKAILVGGMLSVWCVLAATLFSRLYPGNSELYANWINHRRGIYQPSFLEKTASRLGIRLIYDIRLSKDRNLSEKLLHSQDHAFVVASWLDRASHTGWQVKTWPHLKSALASQLRNPDTTALEKSLRLVDSEAFSNWQLTILRSAELSGRLGEIDLMLSELRKHERSTRHKSSLADSLEIYSQIYAQSTTVLARALIDHAKSPVSAGEVLSVLTGRGIHENEAISLLIQDLQSKPLSEGDWSLIKLLISDLRLRHVKADLLTWLLTSGDCEAYRAQHLPDLMKIIEGSFETQPEIAKTLVNKTIRTMSKESFQESSDWQMVARFLISRVGRESDLGEWIDTDAASGFSWWCHILDEEALLIRAIDQWKSGSGIRSEWIRKFMERKQYSAVCALVEAIPGDTSMWDARLYAVASDPPRSISDYMVLVGEITSRCESGQTKGYIHLILSLYLMETSPEGIERNAARSEVIKAIRVLNKSADTNREMLEECVVKMLHTDREIFEEGRPCFDRWRNGATLDDIAEDVYHNRRQPSGTESAIWARYARKIASHHEAPKLCRIIEELIRAAPIANGEDSAASRIGNLIGTSRWGHNGHEVGNMDLTIWVLESMIRQRELEASVAWMFDRLKDYLGRFPGEDESFVLSEIYSKLLYSEIENLTFPERVRWLGLLVDENAPGRYIWPMWFSQFVRDSGSADPTELCRILQSTFENNPLRVWIVRSLLQSIELGSSETERIQTKQLYMDVTVDPWMKSAARDFAENSFNVAAFEHDMSLATEGARHYFMTNPIALTKPAPAKPYASSVYLPDDDRARLLFWETEQALERLELNRAIKDHDLGRQFLRMMELPDRLREDPRFNSIMERFQNVSLDEPRCGLNEYNILSLIEWKARTAHLSTPDTNEIQNLLTNDGLPVTERVWSLVIKGRPEEARQLMAVRKDDLNFTMPPLVKKSDLEAFTTKEFPASLPAGSELCTYAKIYVGSILLTNKYQVHPSSPSPPWGQSVEEILMHEGEIKPMVEAFEETTFTSKRLEVSVLRQVSRFVSSGALMPKKLRSLSEVEGIRNIKETLSCEEFEAELERNDYSNLSSRLEHMKTSFAPWNYSYQTNCLDSLAYHLWKKAIMGDKFTPEQKKLVEAIALESNPLNVLIPNCRNDKASASPYSRTKICALHLGLSIIEAGPQKEVEWSWNKFPGLDINLALKRYQTHRGPSSEIVSNAIAVLAARCGDWSESDRWSLIALFETSPSAAWPTSHYFNTFINYSFIKEDELKKQVRDYAIRYPHHGLRFLSVIYIGRKYGDDSLVQFGLAEAKKYALADPGFEKVLKSYLERSK
jgi:hypothetical protein